MSDPDDPAAWLAKADNDLLCIDNNLASERVPWDTVCFHAQQAAEKAFKAILASRGAVVPRTHDLLVLIDACAAEGCQMTQLRSEAYFLNPLAIAARYPGVAPDPDAAIAQQAVTAARRVVATVRASLDRAD